MTTIKEQSSRKMNPGKLSTWVLFFYFLIQPAIAFSANTVTVAILPMEAQDVSQMNSVKEGVRNMLTSRLSAEEGIELRAVAFVDRILKQEGIGWSRQDMTPLFDPLDVDYLLLPEVVSNESGWTLQVQLFNPFAEGHAAHTFESKGTATGQLVAGVSRLVSEVALFIRDLEEKAAVEDQVGQSAVALKSEDLASFRTAHPERSNPEIVALAGAFRLDKPTSQAEYSLFLTAIGSGDIDADGNDEVVLSGESYLVVKRFQKKEMQQLAVFPMPSGVTAHSVGIADLNANGVAEIYVSGMKDEKPSSFVIEWTPRGFLLLASSIPWYVRVLDMPGDGKVLVGQQFVGDNAGVVSKLFWKNKSLEASGKLHLPRKVNLFDFSMADLDGDGESEIVSITDDGHLQVHDAQHKQLWQSEDFYCGTYRAMAGGKVDDALNPLFSSEHKLMPVPSRIVITDFNHDGKNDIVVNKNPKTIVRMFEDEASYPSGVIIGFVWNGERLQEAWRTMPFEGYVVEYHLGKAIENNVGNPVVSEPSPLRLIVGMRPKEGLFQSDTGKSRIYFFEMNLHWL